MARLDRGRHQAAMAAAVRVRQELDVPDDEPVDVLDAIHRRGIWLVIRRMDALLGVTLRLGDGGIMLSDQRGPSVQRFTAAHELGHWELHPDENSWDFEEDVDADPDDPKEKQANVFASHFLLPRALLNRQLRRYGIGRYDDAAPEVIYGISRDLGLSYTATVNRVADVRDLPWATRRALLRAKPIDLKRSLLDGREPQDRRAHVWLTGTQSDVDMTVDVGDEIFADMPENPSTGYRWLTDIGAPALTPGIAPVVTLLDESFAVTAQPALTDGRHDAHVGAGGVRHFHLRAQTAGEFSHNLLLRRPFEPIEKTLARQSLRGIVRATPSAVTSRFNAGLPERPTA